jgi:hypothetical protein
MSARSFLVVAQGLSAASGLRRKHPGHGLGEAGGGPLPLGSCWSPPVGRRGGWRTWRHARPCLLIGRRGGWRTLCHARPCLVIGCPLLFGKIIGCWWLFW